MDDYKFAHDLAGECENGSYDPVRDVERALEVARALQAAMGKITSRRKFGAVIPVCRRGGPTLAGFETGVGDGCYASYWGFDSAGRVVTLDADFGLLVEGIEAEVVIEGIMRRLGEVLQDDQMKEAGFSIRVTRRKDKQASLAVRTIGPSGDLHPTLLLGSEEVFYRLSSGSDTDAMYLFKVARGKLTPAAALRLRFVKGVRPL
jgi:hypothetical protein